MNRPLLITLASLTAVILVLGVLVWRLNSRLQEEKRAHQRSEQNLAATQDSAGAMFAMLAESAVFVQDLRDSIDGERKVFHALQTRYRIAIDSLRMAGESVEVETHGDSIRVLFSGKESFVAYRGWTLYDLNAKKGTYNLALDFDEPEFSSDLFRNEEDGLWFIRIESLTDGFRYRSTTAIDEETYNLLQQYPPPERTRWLGIGAIGNGESAYGAASIQIAGKYEIIGGYALSKPAGASTFLVGGLIRF